jgi:hypothetical protein
MGGVTILVEKHQSIGQDRELFNPEYLSVEGRIR